MNKSSVFGNMARLALFLGLATALGIGCRSTPKIDWSTRVSNYTYDQAVAELGPPNKTAKLSDGKLVAEWVTRRPGGGMSFGMGTGVYGNRSSVGVGQAIDTAQAERVLRLVFGADNKLQTFSKNF